MKLFIYINRYKLIRGNIGRNFIVNIGSNICYCFFYLYESIDIFINVFI